MLTQDDILKADERHIAYITSEFYVGVKDLFLSYKESLDLRDKGFNEPCIKRWISFQGGFLMDTRNNSYLNSHIFIGLDDECMAPTIDQANKWLKQFNSKTNSSP